MNVSEATGKNKDTQEDCLTYGVELVEKLGGKTLVPVADTQGKGFLSSPPLPWDVIDLRNISVKPL